MKEFALALTLLAGLPLAVAAQVTKEDIKKLAAAGISDDVILSYLHSNGPVVKLSAEDLVELKQAGASEKVLSAVLSGSVAAPTPEYRNDRQAVERQVYSAPSTTYVYDSSPYYYPSAYYYPGYYSGYYPAYYYSSPYYGSRYSYCYPSFGVGFYGGRYYTPRTSFGFSGRVRR
jgi:hypothetical protein